MRRWDQMTFLFAPKGPKQSSPGQRPGNLGTILLRALKGRNGGDITRTFACTALSGLAVGANSPSLLPFPGRCPGLICLGPFGASSSQGGSPTELPWANLSCPFGASSSQGGSPTEVSRRGLVARFHAFPVAWTYLVASCGWRVEAHPPWPPLHKVGKGTRRSHPIRRPGDGARAAVFRGARFTSARS